MFIQVITARVEDEDGVLRQFERWESDLRPGAEGFLGSTGGVTDDGRLVMLARFESEEAARRNSQRPEQDDWWSETAKMLSDVQFHDGVEVIATGGGGSDAAGFVQVMRGRIIDRDKFDEMRPRHQEFESALAKHRPDVMGDVNVLHADGSFTDAVYFTSEAEARENEAKERPAELEAVFSEWSSALTIDEFLDLRRPRMT